MTQRRAGKETKLGMIPLGLKLGDHDQRQHDSVLSEPADGAGVGEQDAGVEHIRAAIRPGACLAWVQDRTCLACLP